MRRGSKKGKGEKKKKIGGTKFAWRKRARGKYVKWQLMCFVSLPLFVFGPGCARVLLDR